jgi:diguanylate cyclase (GGDEF)-like protein
LKTIADQMVLAVNNAKLRSLMKNLAVTDEKSGLLKRSSYLDVLLSEARRALTQNSTASVLLLDFGKASAMVKEMGEPGVENLMQQVGQTICSQVRQNDIAVRYDLTTIALILPDTTDKNAFFVVDKMRKVLTGFKVAGSERPMQITVGIAEAVMHSQYDPIDIVTEVINRVEAALTAAKAEGPNSAKSLAPQLAKNAVA